MEAVGDGCEDAGLEERWQQVRAVLDSKAALLREQGSLVQKKVKGHAYWVVRFFETSEAGTRVQRTLHLGREGALVERVREWLRRLRSADDFLRDTLQMVRFATRLPRLLKPARAPGRRRGPR